MYTSFQWPHSSLPWSSTCGECNCWSMFSSCLLHAYWTCISSQAEQSFLYPPIHTLHLASAPSN